MASPVTGEHNSAVTNFNSLNSAEHNLTCSSQPHGSDGSSRRKRSKRKPRRFDSPETALQNITSVLNDPSSSGLSLQNERSPTNGFKTPSPSSPAMIQAAEFQNSLGTDFPSCIKTMSSSQVNSGFWLGLPLRFCRLYLPREDAMFVLEDENGAQFEAKYIAYKYGLSAGWKRFAIRHNLTVEDVLIFQLVECTKFKVYILKFLLRVNDSSEAAHALSLLNSEAHTEQATPTTPSPKTKKNKRPESLSATASRKQHKKSVPSSSSVPPSGHRIEHSGNNNEDGSPEILECSRPSDRPLSFKEVKSFQDFHIIVKGVCLDDELPNDVRMDYYKLCVYNKEFLHDGLSEGLYDKLVPGMIGQIVNVVNEIKRFKITATKKDFGRWDNSLQSFEQLGMKVGFLRDKIRTLATLLFESEAAVDIEQYVEARNEHKRAEDEIKKVAAKLKELKETAKKFDGVASCLKQNVEKYEHKLDEEVDGLW